MAVQKWEYLQVQCDWGEKGYYAVPRRVNGQELRDWKKGPSVYVYLNELGAQGWELICQELLVYTFKRPKM
jgi:hypothetical protein